MAAGVGGPTRASIDARTLRQDRWWLYPAVTFTVFSAFVVYSTIRAFMDSDYFAEPYLSPFYSPCLGDCVEGSSDFGQPFGWFPLSAALIILIFPLGFRLTCYYYRKAYYRAFWLSPAGLRRRRAARGVHRRDPVPADPPERAPLVLVRHLRGRADPDLGRRPGLRSAHRASPTASTWVSARC